MPDLAPILALRPAVPLWADLLAAAALLALGWLLCLALGVFRRVRHPGGRLLCVLAAAAILHAGAITARSKGDVPGPGPGPEPADPTNAPPAAVSVPALLLPGRPERAVPLAAPILILQ